MSKVYEILQIKKSCIANIGNVINDRILSKEGCFYISNFRLRHEGSPLLYIDKNLKARTKNGVYNLSELDVETLAIIHDRMAGSF